jgi:hypothetical protein
LQPGNFYLLRLQYCSGQLTIHGLWFVVALDGTTGPQFVWDFSPKAKHDETGGVWVLQARVEPELRGTGL